MKNYYVILTPLLLLAALAGKFPPADARQARGTGRAGRSHRQRESQVPRPQLYDLIGRWVSGFL